MDLSVFIYLQPLPSSSCSFCIMSPDLLTQGDIQALFLLVTSWGLWATCVHADMCVYTGVHVYTQMCVGVHAGVWSMHCAGVCKHVCRRASMYADVHE